MALQQQIPFLKPFKLSKHAFCFYFAHFTLALRRHNTAWYDQHSFLLPEIII